MPQVSCGAKHVLAATANGHLFAWGDNSRGQCGVMWSSSSSPAVASPSDHSDGDSDSDDWWDDYGGRGGVGSADLKKLQGAGADGQQDGPGGKKGVDIFDGEGESATSGKAVGGSWGGSRDGGQERHGEHGGYGPRVVRRPTVVSGEVAKGEGLACQELSSWSLAVPLCWGCIEFFFASSLRF